MARLHDFNAMPAAELAAALTACADVPAWVDGVLAGRPYATAAAARARADALARDWTDADVDRALAAHPRIGERAAPDRGTAPDGDDATGDSDAAAGGDSTAGDGDAAAGEGVAARHSAAEQAGVATDADTQARLRAGNAAYEARFGRVFLIRAAGRGADAILAELERRLGNDEAAERAEVARELREIALRRFEPLVSRAVLGDNRYGKAEVRLVRVDRDTPRHTLTDLTVTSQLRGDFTRASHLVGDNALVVATDTQKNTVFGLARDGVGAPEAFLLRLADHFPATYPWVTGGRFTAQAHAWDRIGDADHAFSRAGRVTRTARVDADGDHRTVHGGLTDLTVMKTTDSEFHGFPRDRWTTLPETDDRILASSVTADWRYVRTDLDFDAAYATIEALLLETFASLHSLALQQTLFAMGEAVVERCEAVAEIRLSLPNRHHFLVDLEPFGLDNPGEVFVAADRPYGLIEATVTRAPDRG